MYTIKVKRNTNSFTVKHVDRRVVVRSVGKRGLPGPGIISGGTTGQALVKASNNDFDMEWATVEGVGDGVTSVNGQTGVVVLDADDISDTSTSHKFTSASEISKLAGIESGADVTDAANVAAAGAVMTTGSQTVSGAKTFDAGAFLDRGNEIFNVKAYGAVGDDSNDDTSAIQAAIDAASSNDGGVVYLPSGTYRITSALELHSGVTLRGDGCAGYTGSANVNLALEVPVAATVIHQVTNDVDAISNDTEGADFDLRHVTIEDLMITGTGSGTGNGINLGWGTDGRLAYLTFKNVHVYNFGNDGLRLQTPIVSHFDTVVSQSNGQHGFNLYYAGTSCAFTSCFAMGNGGAGFFVGGDSPSGAAYLSFNACATDFNDIGYHIVNSQTVALQGCGSEYSTTNALVIDASNTIVVNGFEAIGTEDATAILITNGSFQVTMNGVAHNTTSGTTTFIQVDEGSEATIGAYRTFGENDTNNFAGTVTILNDSGGNMTMPGSLTANNVVASGQNGSLTLSADTDGGEFNLSSSASGVLALFGSGGNALNLQLLDGYLQLDPLTASTVAYIDANKRFASSAVTPTELGYLSGVTSAIQAQLDGKQPLDADLTALAAAGNSSVLAATTASFLVADKSKLDGIEAGAEVNDVDSVNGQTGAVVLDADDIDDSSTAHKFATATQLSNADSALQPSDIASGTITARNNDIDFSGGSDGDVLTVQSDGSLALEPPAGGGGTMDDFTLEADSGDPQTIADGNTLTVAGGTGIDTATSDTDTVTISLDSSSQASLALADTAVQDLGDLGITASSDELNVLDGIPGTLTATELGYVDGVTSAIQTQLDGKQPLDADLTVLAAANNSSVLAATTASFLSADKSKLDGIESGADVTDATNVSSSGGVIRVAHGATANTTRPSVSGAVLWVGSVEPANATDGDIWIDTA